MFAGHFEAEKCKTCFEKALVIDANCTDVFIHRARVIIFYLLPFPFLHVPLFLSFSPPLFIVLCSLFFCSSPLSSFLFHTSFLPLSSLSLFLITFPFFLSVFPPPSPSPLFPLIHLTVSSSSPSPLLTSPPPLFYPFPLLFLPLSSFLHISSLSTSLHYSFLLFFPLSLHFFLSLFSPLTPPPAPPFLSSPPPPLSHSFPPRLA